MTKLDSPQRKTGKNILTLIGNDESLFNHRYSQVHSHYLITIIDRCSNRYSHPQIDGKVNPL